MQRELMLSNISEAREQLEAIEKKILSPDYKEINFRLELEHAYHHLNFAWNIRNESDEVLTILAKEDFIKLSKYPKEDIEEYEY
jgi:hypothetical protein